jgi:hypothetical protein
MNKPVNIGKGLVGDIKHSFTLENEMSDPQVRIQHMAEFTRLLVDLMHIYKVIKLDVCFDPYALNDQMSQKDISNP